MSKTQPFGWFDDAAREYVIRTPETPLPWLNYFGQDAFFGLCTQTGGGYHFFKDAKLRRLTRYRYNSVPLDESGRYLYIRDGDTVWSPTWKPAKTPLDTFECRHGTGYSLFRSSHNALSAELRFFTPRKAPVELWSLTLTHTGREKKSVAITSYLEFCFYEALNDATNFQRTWSIGETVVRGGSIFHTTEYRERRDHYTLFHAYDRVDGFDTDQFSFLGKGGTLQRPAAVMDGSRQSMASGWNPVGSHCLFKELAPGDSVRIDFMLAYVTVPKEEKFIDGEINLQPAHELIRAFDTSAKIDAAFGDLKRHWDSLLSNFQIETPCPAMNRMGNLWNQVQCMTTFHLSRSASMFESGIGRGMGFRDSNQDLLGCVHMEPLKARQRILDIAATQFESGLCFHQYQPLTKTGNADIGGEFMDDHLWLILSTTAYVKETGDTSILWESIGYADSRASNATLADHLWTSFRYTLDNLGPHQLPLIGHADWNDCLNLNCYSEEPNESFQTAPHRTDGKVAESFMIAGLFMYACTELEALFKELGDPRAPKVATAREAMLAAVETHGWDGDWYLRAFDATGAPVGSSANADGRIYIESQAWLILGGAGRDNGRAAQALASVSKHLGTPHGLVILDPPYRQYHPALGEVSSYPPGYKENGGIFCHNNPWIHLALLQLGMADEAYEGFKAICPATKDDMERYMCEPYVYAQMIAGKGSPNHGQAKNSWLTGTAAWTLVLLMQGFCGLRPSYRGLLIDPCVPSAWDGFKVTRKFRGTTYVIECDNPNHRCCGVKHIWIDGRLWEDKVLPLGRPGSTLNVRILID